MSEIEDNAQLLYDLITDFTRQNPVKLADLLYVFQLIGFKQLSILENGEKRSNREDEETG